MDKLPMFYTLIDKKAKLVDILFTDNCGIVSHFKLAKVHVIYGCESNIKIAYSIDIFITDKIFQIIKENI